MVDAALTKAKELYQELATEQDDPLRRALCLGAAVPYLADVAAASDQELT